MIEGNGQGEVPGIEAARAVSLAPSSFSSTRPVDHNPRYNFFPHDEKNANHCTNLSILKRKRRKIRIARNAPTLRKSTIIMLALVPSFASLFVKTHPHALVYKKLVKNGYYHRCYFFLLKFLLIYSFWLFFFSLRKPMITLWCVAFQTSRLLKESRYIGTYVELFLSLFLYKNVTYRIYTSLLLAYLT